MRLCRPETANLLDQGVIAALTNALRELAGQAGLRAIVLSAEGDTFCAGIDLRWMQAGAHASPGDNLRSAATLARLFKAIHDSPVPTIAKIQGDALSAGLGLVAACDIAIANDHARFRTREVRVGILPALMSPCGAGARTQAGEIPVPDGQAPVGAGSAAGGPAAPDLPERRAGRHLVASCVDDIVQGSPASLPATKALVQTVAHRAVTDQVVAETTACIADFRARGQAQAGIACAIDGVLPPWMEDHESSR
ncbi:enoyl-CoA hydratase-related protein [Achromobacter xylosoxidans]